MTIFSVSEYIHFINDSLAALVPYNDLAIEGEVAGFKVSQSKWVWFDLKDKDGLISCFMVAWDLKVPLADGMKIRVLGAPRLYQKTGKFSVTVKAIELLGEGALKKAYEMLKKRLMEEGLFAPERKRPLPRFPQRIALITSPEAAAYTDFLRILNNRWGGVEVDLLPVAVQGMSAPGEIAAAFHWLNQHSADYDVCVLTRGGGNLEDLQAFNDESTVRAVYGSKVPVVCGVGHERDETLCDLAADVRASTPSNAAERVAPSREEVLGELDFMAEQLESDLLLRVSEARQKVESAFDLLEHRLAGPLENCREVLKKFETQFNNFVFQLDKKKTGVETLERLFAGLNPRRLLERGYGLVRGSSGLIRSAKDVDTGDKIMIELSQGQIDAEVLKTHL